jgi:hypothetical protein
MTTTPTFTDTVGRKQVSGSILMSKAGSILVSAEVSGRALEERMYWDSLTFDVVKQWRTVHYPITLAFAVLAVAHIIGIFLFWSWR